MAHEGTEREIRETAHRGQDDLLTAGLGLHGLKGRLARVADAGSPSAAELRRRAIQTSWKGIADLGPLGGFGSVYGAAPHVPGREFAAFARLPGANAPHRVLVQVPDAFDRGRRCLVVTASPGSRGIYGGIAVAGAWALPRGFAVAYTDKGAGTGYFDAADRTGVRLDGTRGTAGDAVLEFVPPDEGGAAGLAVKHAHSGDHPEADWGRHVLQAARFGLDMLDRAFPDQAPFTPSNTLVIAVGLSNGGGAVLQAAGLDDEGLLAAVVAAEPNVHVPSAGRPLFDYATEAALYLPAALAAPAFDAVPFARAGALPMPAWSLRGLRLREAGLLDGMTPMAHADEALQRLLAQSWTLPTLSAAAAAVSVDLWRSLGAGYASAYLRATPASMPSGYAYRPLTPWPGGIDGRPLWWADATGLPPALDIALTGGVDLSADPAFPGLHALRELWTGPGADAERLRTAVAGTQARLPRMDMPVMVVHGAEDGLVPPGFSSRPYVRWLRDHGRNPVHWQVPHAQHFDAFLSFAGFGDRYVPLLPYVYRALDRVAAHLMEGRALPEDAACRDARPRGGSPLTAAALALPPP